MKILNLSMEMVSESISNNKDYISSTSSLIDKYSLNAKFILDRYLPSRMRATPISKPSTIVLYVNMIAYYLLN